MKRLICLFLLLCLPLAALAEGTPAHVTEQLYSQSGHTSIAIDADVIVPEADAIPRYQVQRREFTAAEVHAMARALFGGRAYTGDEGFVTNVNPDMPNAHYESASMSLKTEELRDGWPLYWLSAYQSYLKENHSLQLASVEFMPSGDTYYRNSGFSPVPEGGAVGCSVTLEDARETANAAVAAFAPQLTLTAEGVMWADSYEATDARKEAQRHQGYAFGYTRNLPLPVLYEETLVRGEFSNVVCQERLIIVVDDNGIYWASYERPYEITGVIDEDCQLLPFDKIMDVARTIFPLRHLSLESFNKEIRMQISRITLSSMEVLSRGHPDQCEVIPVWDFFGTAVLSPNAGDEPILWDSPCQSLLTINALDGTVIDRNYGY